MSNEPIIVVYGTPTEGVSRPVSFAEGDVFIVATDDLMNAPEDVAASYREFVETRGTTLTDLVLVQVLLYDLTMEAADIEDAAIWAQHFGFDRDPNVYVVVSKADLRGKASFRMIPGVQLVDKGSVLRFDSTGHQPKHNLWTELLPAVPWLLEG